jgi:capsular polysaccharide export protein
MNPNSIAMRRKVQPGEITATAPHVRSRQSARIAAVPYATDSHPVASKATDHNPALEKLANTDNLLMLQGPVGPMFDRVASWKKKHGAQVHRIVFNAGDAHFCNALQPSRYIGTAADWPKYLRRYIQDNKIEAVLVFGQSRKYHAAAVLLCRAMGIHLFVMEEGYIRPGFITLEIDGVNGHSTTLQKFHLAHESTVKFIAPAAPVHYQFMRGALYGAMYYGALAISKNNFALYQHHRETSPVPYTLHWLKSAITKLTKSLPNNRFIRHLENAPPYFFIPLQLDTDAQVVNHSEFDSCISFLRTVIGSFAGHSPDNARLIIKQHPLARGESKVEQFALHFSKALGLENRISFLYEGHIPTLIKHARGVVTINSTVGLQAIHQHKPLKVLGNALYEHTQVTDSKPLHQFWRSPMQPDVVAAKKLYASIKILTQASAEIYASRSVPLQWPESRGNNANT